MILHRRDIETRLPVSCQRPILLSALLILSPLAQAGFAAELTPVRLGYGGIAGYQLPLWVSKETRTGIKTMALSSKHSPADFMDMSLLDEIEQEVFDKKFAEAKDKQS
jgi:hypothetical protein